LIGLESYMGEQRMDKADEAVVDAMMGTKAGRPTVEKDTIALVAFGNFEDWFSGRPPAGNAN
jgi:hypothetical protein